MTATLTRERPTHRGRVTSAAKTTTLRAALYCRISDDRNDDELGVTRQLGDVEAYAKRKGYDVVGTFVDNDVSASKGIVRPEFERMMTMVRAGQIDVIVPWVLDRLYRSVSELEQLISLAESLSGLRIESAEGGNFDLNSPEGRGFARIVVTVARMEVEKMTQRIKAKHRELAEAGASPGGPRPFGWADDRRSLHPVEAPLLLEAIQRVLSGETVRAICLDWNKRGLATPQAGRRDVKVSSDPRWTAQALLRMLINPRLKGVRALRGAEVATGEWEPIIDANTFERLTAVLQRKRMPSHTNVRKYLLPGFLFCGSCAAPMRAHSKAQGVRYTCNTDQGGCGKRSTTAAPVDDIVRDFVMERADPKRVGRMRQGGGSSREATALRTLDAARTRLDDIAAKWGAGELSDREYEIAREAARSTLEDAEKTYTNLTGDVVAASLITPDLPERWETLTLDQQRTIISAFIERVELLPARSKGGRFDPERVRITPR